MPTKPAFTMIELITVITIIVLVLAMAVPVVRSVEGNRSLDAGYNTIAAALGHARQIALYYRSPAGVVFFKLPGGQQKIGYVMQERNIAADATNSPSDDRYVDLIPGEEFLTLPAGLAVQLLNNPVIVGSNTVGDNYLRMGVVLFDENGQLAAVPYWIRAGTRLAFNLSQTVNGVLVTSVFPPTGPGLIPPLATASGTTLPNDAALFSHQAICLYDDDSYQSQVDPSTGMNFGAADATTNIANSVTYPQYYNPSTSPNASTKKAEQTWLATNAQVLVIKPNDGSLLRNQ